MLLTDSREQEQLSWFMSYISRDRFAAGWCIGLERTLWHFMQDETKDIGYPPLMEKGVREQLRAYHEEAGGWIIWDSDRKPLSGTRFIEGEELAAWVDKL
jgi:hypothetical protein